MKDERKELFFSDLYEVFEPKSNMSELNLKDKWRVLPIYTEEYCSKAIYAGYYNEADLTFAPNLTGWYKIYLHFYSNGIDIKLTSDPTFLPVRRSPSERKDGLYVSEVLWRCADMTGEALTVSRRKFTCEYDPTVLTAIRFVPMTEEETAEWKYEQERTDTRCIYATDDMHNSFYYRNFTEMSDWFAVVENYDHSDVEWISVEQIRNFVSDRMPTQDINNVAFQSTGDMLVQKNKNRFDYDEVLRQVVKYGKTRGFKMSVSMRMGAWGLPFPYDQYYFDCDYMMEHPELRTVDRNGEEIFALSYAYPEVRNYVVNELINMAETGCDAVTLIAHRGIPYLLYEKPVADRFFELYGEYPYELPLDEPRLHSLHCEIMTDFFRQARKALDQRFPDRHVELHLRGLFSVFDTKYIGFDTETLAREGLIDVIVSFPQRHYETLHGDVWREGESWRIDLDKYTEYCHKNAGTLTVHQVNFDFAPPYENYKGEPCGPATQKERIAQWTELERNYGVKIYYEIFPRQMTNREFKRRAVDLYDCGAERLALWDTYDRAPAKAMWSTVRRFGHKQELRDMDAGEGEYYRELRVYKIGQCDMSRYNPLWGG